MLNVVYCYIENEFEKHGDGGMEGKRKRQLMWEFSKTDRFI